MSDRDDAAAQGVAGLGRVTAMSPDELRLADDNPRRIPEAAVMAVIESLREFGWQQPIVVDERNEVLAGHTRLQAARRLKLSSVPVVVADRLDERQGRAFRIADNRTHDYSMWDMPILVDQLDDLSDEFSEVLGLADWEAMLGELEGGGDDDALNDLAGIDDDEEAGSSGGTGTGKDRDDTDLDVPEDLRETFKGFQVVVCFRTQETADAAGPTLLEIPGVFDVRHKR